MIVNEAIDALAALRTPVTEGSRPLTRFATCMDEPWTCLMSAFREC